MSFLNGKRKIIIRLSGGLGNQLFQYALGKYLSLKLECNLYLDTFEYRRHKLRKYELHHLKINAKILPLFWQIFCHVFVFKLGRFFCKEVLYKEPFFHFDENVLNIKTSKYLIGAWQSEKYFSSIRSDLLEHFQFNGQIPDEYKNILTLIESTESVSIHIRRGDYVSNPVTNALHGVLPLDYYTQSIDYISARYPNITLFVFSDDFAWVKENINMYQNLYYVDSEDKNPHYDLILMSKCKHNIIANSTFSWWGAWLNQYENKVVCIPKKWSLYEGSDSKDISPSSWVII